MVASEVRVDSTNDGMYLTLSCRLASGYLRVAVFHLPSVLVRFTTLPD